MADYFTNRYNPEWALEVEKAKLVEYPMIIRRSQRADDYESTYGSESLPLIGFSGNELVMMVEHQEQLFVGHPHYCPESIIYFKNNSDILNILKSLKVSEPKDLEGKVVMGLMQYSSVVGIRVPRAKNSDNNAHSK